MKYRVISKMEFGKVHYQTQYKAFGLFWADIGDPESTKAEALAKIVGWIKESQHKPEVVSVVSTAPEDQQ